MKYYRLTISFCLNISFPPLSCLIHISICLFVLLSTSGAGTAYPSGAPRWGSCYSIFSFTCMFCRSFLSWLYILFLLSIVLSFFFDLRILITYLVYSNPPDRPIEIKITFLSQWIQKRDQTHVIQCIYVVFLSRIEFDINLCRFISVLPREIQFSRWVFGIPSLQ